MPLLTSITTVGSTCLRSYNRQGNMRFKIKALFTCARLRAIRSVSYYWRVISLSRDIINEIIFCFCWDNCQQNNKVSLTSYFWLDPKLTSTKFKLSKYEKELTGTLLTSNLEK